MTVVSNILCLVDTNSLILLKQTLSTATVRHTMQSDERLKANLSVLQVRARWGLAHNVLLCRNGAVSCFAGLFAIVAHAHLIRARNAGSTTMRRSPTCSFKLVRSPPSSRWIDAVLHSTNILIPKRLLMSGRSARDALPL